MKSISESWTSSFSLLEQIAQATTILAIIHMLPLDVDISRIILTQGAPSLNAWLSKSAVAVQLPPTIGTCHLEDLVHYNSYTL